MTILDDIHHAMRLIEESKKIIVCSETMFPKIQAELALHPEYDSAFKLQSVPDAMLPDVSTVYIMENPSRLLRQ